MEVKADEITMVDVDSLTHHEKNPNKHPEKQIDRLVELIKYQGFRNPLVVQKGTSKVVCGNGRLMAARKIGMEKVPVMYQEFTGPEQLYAYLVSDNEIARWATTDLAMVNADIIELGPELEIDMLGIPDFVVEPIEKYDEETQDDVPGIKHDPITKRGDVWILGDHRLSCDDSFSITSVDHLMQDKKAGMAFMDPPYHDSAFSSIYACCESHVENANVFVMLDDKSMLQYLSVSALEFREFIVADLLFRVRKGKSALLQHILISRETKGSPRPFNITRDGFSSIVKIKYRGNLKDESVGHKHQKPVALLEKLLLHYSHPGDVVLDLFGGSGTTLLACEKFGSSCRMMEIDEENCDVIVERWQKLTGKEAVLESNGKSYNEMKDVSQD